MEDRSAAPAGAELPPAAAERLEGLRALVAGMESAVIAYSGGVDSTVLLRVAHDVLGERALGVFAVSPSVPARERRDALRFAASFGAAVRVIETREMDDPRYRANGTDRCYFCKGDLFSRLAEIARTEGFRSVADGTNRDDLGDFRPGRAAAAELGVRSPFVEAGIGKEEIREIAGFLGLECRDKPAAPCLASRIVTGIEVTDGRLRAIEAAEEGLRDLGFEIVRVRHEGSRARVEVDERDLGRLDDRPLRERAVQAVRAAGFTDVVIDPNGYRRGGGLRMSAAGSANRSAPGGPMEQGRVDGQGTAGA
jgi:uncharacterized protein